MKIYKSKIMKAINFIKNEGKFERGDMVRVTGVDLGTKYAKYYHQYGIVVSIDYTKKDYIVSVKFEDGKVYDFKCNELTRITPENPIRYKKLNIEY